MPQVQDLQVLILLSLIPTVIATMYSLTQVSEHIRERHRARKRIAEMARRLRSRPPRGATTPRISSRA